MQSTRLSTTDWIRVGILLAGGFIALVYIPFGWSGIGAALRSEVTAAWLQAIGSILGLALAIWVPTRMRAMELEDRRRQAEAHSVVKAVKITIQLRTIEAFARMCTEAIEKHRAVQQAIPFGEIEAFMEYLNPPDDDDVLLILPIHEALGARISLATTCLSTVKLMIKHRSHFSSPESHMRSFTAQEPILRTILEQVRESAWILTEFNRGRIPKPMDLSAGVIKPPEG